MKTVCVIFGFVALFCLFEYGTAIKCYECNSYYQQDCGDHFDNQTINMVECPPEATKCRKQVQEVLYNDYWDVRYIRQCATLGEIGDYEGRSCKERAGTYKVKVRYCHCDNQDGCNSVSSLHYTISALVLSLVAYFLVKVVR